MRTAWSKEKTNNIKGEIKKISSFNDLAKYFKITRQNLDYKCNGKVGFTEQEIEYLTTHTNLPESYLLSKTKKELKKASGNVNPLIYKYNEFSLLKGNKINLMTKEEFNNYIKSCTPETAFKIGKNAIIYPDEPYIKLNGYAADSLTEVDLDHFLDRNKEFKEWLQKKNTKN